MNSRNKSLVLTFALAATAFVLGLLIGLAPDDSAPTPAKPYIFCDGKERVYVAPNGGYVHVEPLNEECNGNDGQPDPTQS